MERLTIDEVIEHCRRTCENTEMLAIARGQEQSDITSKNYWEHYQVEEWLKELKEYREAKKQGMLLKLPFKVGDMVYSAEYEEVKAYTITNFRVYETAIYAYAGYTYIGEVGMSVFATKEEAEKALEEMEE